MAIGIGFLQTLPVSDKCRLGLGFGTLACVTCGMSTSYFVVPARWQCVTSTFQNISTAFVVFA
jgi:hypothetical protein